MDANLGNLMRTCRTRSIHIHPKTGAEYLFHHTESFPQDWLLSRGISFGWVRLKCVYRRSGVSFFHICGDNTKHEEVFFDDSCFIYMLYPVDLNLAAFKFNKDHVHTLKLAPGQIIS